MVHVNWVHMNWVKPFVTNKQNTTYMKIWAIYEAVGLVTLGQTLNWVQIYVMNLQNKYHKKYTYGSVSAGRGKCLFYGHFFSSRGFV